MGCGQQKGYTEVYRGVDVEVNLLKKVRVEIAVNDTFVDATIDAIVHWRGNRNYRGRQDLRSSYRADDTYQKP